MKTIRLTLVALALCYIMAVLAKFNYGFLHFLDVYQPMALIFNVVILYIFNKKYGNSRLEWLFGFVAVLCVCFTMFYSWNYCGEKGHVRILDFLDIKFSDSFYAATLKGGYYLFWTIFILEVLAVLLLGIVTLRKYFLNKDN
ncbi:hypothetical protein GN157_06480 [Flavobacterium rakeshii]|uniref:Uncharacterized protein n=1 Tax=Flavobacterium rakeshii TaxID=1038845 RepID=A0A6N8HAP5_9FLAO|nr:hypothetical protein [Flavobacterium rakeshii]MEE1898017.1 hypothetical protein [Flavobacterium rakeshii]MUV03352.1 hypothetical protein [Flavobacterium rakeshii]